MTQPATIPGPIGVSPPRRDRRLRRTALAAALAAAGLASTNAWALTDACTTATTTISSNVAGADDQNCLLATGESLIVQAGISFAASTVTNFTDAVLTPGTPAGSINNAGTIYADDYRPIVVTGTLSGGLVNQSGALIDGAEGIEVFGQLQNGIVNDGTIQAHGGDDCDAIRVLGGGQIIGGIVNRGTITPCVGDLASRGIYNQNSIDRIDNLQGGQGGPPALTYRGVLPAAYRIIVEDTSAFGTLAADLAVTGTMTFDIAPGSNLQVHTYPDVLAGVLQARLAGPLSGTFGAFNWELVVANAGNGVWDLVVTQAVPAEAATPVPALPVWGGALLSALLGALGALGLRRRRRG